MAFFQTHLLRGRDRNILFECPQVDRRKRPSRTRTTLHCRRIEVVTKDKLQPIEFFDALKGGWPPLRGNSLCLITRHSAPSGRAAGTFLRQSCCLSYAQINFAPPRSCLSTISFISRLNLNSPLGFPGWFAAAFFRLGSYRNLEYVFKAPSQI